MRQWRGEPYPLGSTWTGNGVNFALYSQNATAVELCLFNPLSPSEEILRVNFHEKEDEVWHAFLPDIRPGQLYGYRVYGPWNPLAGHRFDPNKLLIDPYAKAIAGEFSYGPSMYSYQTGHPSQDQVLFPSDNRDVVPKSVVIDPAFNWAGDVAPNRPIEETIIYEVHVKGFSKLWQNVPEALRGTYRGLAHPESIAYFKGLGVTAIELLPIHEIADEPFLLERNLCNYWGYNSIGFFAPASRYRSSPEIASEVREFKEMVRSLHQAGLEVILDVVYNHTAEGNHLGPTLSLKGIDNSSYYRLVKDQPRYYMDYTGTGNTVNVPNPRVLQLIMDSLRYWVLEMHVDGFRFDLAPTLAREAAAVSKLSSFFTVIHQDPVISQVKLIAEPWDLGHDGYQVGNFPHLWCEWNGKYRDGIRHFWRGDPVSFSDWAYRLMGSPDLYESSSKRPTASINFVTCHDGFTLADLVSYNEKHNEANGENNNDGSTRNLSWNCGAEGPTNDEEILTLRRKQRRNIMITLLLSQGVPMICAGDEYGRTQQGNNNAYCQDSEVSWLSWSRSAEETVFQEFVSKLIALRSRHPVFQRPKFYQYEKLAESELHDMCWLGFDGSEIVRAQWLTTELRKVGLLLVGRQMDIRDYQGNHIKDDTFFLVFNGDAHSDSLSLPGGSHVAWEWMLNSTMEKGFTESGGVFPAKSKMVIPERSIHLFRQVGGGDHEVNIP